MSAIQQALAGYKANASVTYATFDPSAKSAQITLSNGNLTATDGSTGFSSVKGTISKSSGKWYWEIKVDSGEPNQNIGICNSSLNVNNNPTDANAYCYFASGFFFYSTTNLQTVASYTTNDTIGIAFDAGAGTVSFYKNNTLQGSAITGITGSWFPFWESYYSPGKGTANFGATTMAYTAPTGYNQGLYN